MTTNRRRHFLARVNANAVLGFPPGGLFVAHYHPGGGFAGRAEVLVLRPVPPGRTGYVAVEFPEPSGEIEYHVGGNVWSQSLLTPEGCEHWRANLEKHDQL